MIFFNNVHSTLRSLSRLRNLQTISINLDVPRTYSRWSSRTPTRIVNEDELFDVEDTTVETVNYERKPRRRRSLNEASKKPSVSQKPSASPRSKTKENEKKSPFIVLEDGDRIISKLMTNVKTRKRREKNEEIILEGHRLIKEGIEAGGKPTAILFNNSSDLDLLNLPKDVKLYKVPYKTIKLWSTLTTSPGLIGIFKTPDLNKNPSNNAIPLTIICDNVREPGNLGSIIRAAAGVGCEKLILMKGCVDLWEPKVLRSAAGGHFRVPIVAFPMWDEIPSLIDVESNVFLADSNFGDEFLSKYSDEILETSMGVFNTDPEILKANIIINNDDINESTPINKTILKQLLLKLPIVPYYTLDYTKKEVVLILTGETMGLSVDSYTFLRDRKGVRINIPLLNGVDSLNVGVALGIVTFEMKRQFIKKQSELQ
ncbi:rRNA methyltransferase 3, mitochondrial [Hylaeus volcanicus]|uniref:rRNA methyltransferase 3, mitochondrial n=1 Tax=Hylaeus volcanicus TaxID=313075 RepID=UPI0023B84AE5|nr:rRNA methyltransferase 3, mitochondrial [Hylaeus volcanicus]